MLPTFTRRGFSSLLALFPLLCAPALSRPVSAAPAFPYDATVRTSEVEVRSGPGQRYYVTGQVRQSQTVTVHRHDPGGWYMIAPPPGSFSYLETAFVRRTGDAAGVVEVPALETPDAPRAIVRIGSEFSDDHSYYGRELSTGDEVQILGEKTLSTDRGAVRMYMIAPPQLEYRWVKGDFIVPVGEVLPATPTVDSFVRPVGGFAAATPAASAEKPMETDPFAIPFRPGATPSSTAQTTDTASRSTVVVPAAGTREALSQLDLRYLEVLQQTPEYWDLDRLVSDYQALRLHAGGEMAAQIDDRLAALESRRKVWNDYQEFVRLTTETSQRDAALVAMQSGGIVQASFDPEVAGAQGSRISPIPTTDATAGPILNPSFLATAGSQPASASPQLAPATPQFTPPGAATDAPRFDPTSAVPQFDGAGILQRMPTGPQGQFVHVLADSRGRVLAVLQAPPGLNLDGHVGRSLGVVGHRYHDPRLRSDVIKVQQILPVQLAPAGR